MSKPKYSILKETFCLYCDKEYGTPKKLQTHVLKKHPESHAANAIQDAYANRVLGQNTRSKMLGGL